MTIFYAIRNDGCNFKTLDLGRMDALRCKPERAVATIDDVIQFSLLNTSMSDWWITPETRFIGNEGAVNPKVPDISLWVAGAALVLSPKAKRILGDLLSKFGEFLPVKNIEDGETYWIFNCLSNSDVIEAESYWEFQGGIPIALTSLGIPDAAQVLTVFKVPYEGCVTLYCSDQFKDVAKEYELSGLYFDKNLIEPVLQD